MYYVYLLKCSDNKYYIGQTSDIEKRIIQHCKGKVKSTKYRRPLNLIGFEKYKTRNKARWRELCLKKSASKRKKFYEKLDS